MNNQQNDRFQEVGSSSSNNPRWEPQKTDLIQGAPLPVLDGYFKDLRELVGQKGAFTVAVVTTVNPDGSLGQDVDISGGKTLEDKLNDVPLGTFIRIQYEGKVKSKSSGNFYNNFKVFKDDNAIPFNQLGGHVKQQSQQQGNNNANVFNPNQNNQQQQSAPQFNPAQNFQNAPQQFNQQANPNFQQGAPVFNSSGNAQNFQQPPVQQNFQQQATPTQQQTWTPPAPVQQQQPPVQNNGQNFAQQNGGANVFGGNQENNGLPF
jgi:hypothetical protein